MHVSRPGYLNFIVSLIKRSLLKLGSCTTRQGQLQRLHVVDQTLKYFNARHLHRNPNALGFIIAFVLLESSIFLGLTSPANAATDRKGGGIAD